MVILKQVILMNALQVIVLTQVVSVCFLL